MNNSVILSMFIIDFEMELICFLMQKVLHRFAIKISRHDRKRGMILKTTPVEIARSRKGRAGRGEEWSYRTRQRRVRRYMAMLKAQSRSGRRGACKGKP